MTEESEKVMRLVAAQDDLPQETDAPVDVGPAYDAGLLMQLEDHGPEALKEYGKIVVRDVADSARYNASVWYALAYDLVWEHRGDVVVITDPKNPA